MSAVQSLIEAHRAAVAADEANFTDDGRAINADAAATSGDVEVKAYRALVAEPCETAEDVQAKLNYFLNGSVGIRLTRLTLIDCLLDICYSPYESDRDDSVETILRSLLVAP